LKWARSAHPRQRSRQNEISKSLTLRGFASRNRWTKSRGAAHPGQSPRDCAKHDPQVVSSNLSNPTRTTCCVDIHNFEIDFHHFHVTSWKCECANVPSGSKGHSRKPGIMPMTWIDIYVTVTQIRIWMSKFIHVGHIEVKISVGHETVVGVNEVFQHTSKIDS
jgi:hypothetical protein